MVDFRKLYSIFVDEAAEKIAELESGLLQLEKSPDDKELLNTIFRAAHTIKGSSGTIGLKDISHFTHGMEEILDLMRQDRLTPDNELVSVLLEAADLIKEMVECVASEAAFEFSRCEAVTQRMEAVKKHRSEAVPAAGPDQVKKESQDTAADLRHVMIKFVPNADLFKRGIDPAIILNDIRGLGEVVTIHAFTDTVPPLSDINPENLYMRWDIHLKTSKSDAEIRKVFEFVEEGSDIKILPIAVASATDLPFIGQLLVGEGSVKAEDVEDALKSQKRLGEILLEKGKITSKDLEKAVEKQNQKKTESLRNAISSTIRVDLKKLDHLINTVGEMVIIHSMFQQLLQNGSERTAEGIEALFSQLQRIGRDIQESAMALRMLPVGEVFHRFTRLVRELSISKGKNIELVISGEDTELDKGVLEKITDPLVHLIRNAIDHGIETPDERAAQGKPPQGTIHLSAYQMGDAVYIEIEDDGKGLSKERILKKAQVMGMLGNDTDLTDEQIYNLIFLPGLSTADQVTDISGRGVGMDVVKKNIESLNGKVQIRSKPGMGTTISIKLPLTLAIIDGLTVLIGNEPFIIPITMVIESLRPEQKDIKTLNERGEVINIRGEYIPLVRLYRLLGLMPQQENPWEAIVIVTTYEGRKYGLLVDELIGQQQIVIKHLGTAMPRVRDIAGGTILGNGKVALVLDIPGIVELSRQQ